MELTGKTLVRATQEQTWASLNDAAVLARCISGCEGIDKKSDTQYEVKIAVKIGPVNAKFKGNLTLSNVMPPQSYTITFEGQGGPAGFGKGGADVRLQPAGDGTEVHYAVKAQVGGKIAQVGSRLVDATAKKMADDFFACFAREFAGAEAAVPAPAAAAAPRLAWLWVVLVIAALLALYWLTR